MIALQTITWIYQKYWYSPRLAALIVKDASVFNPRNQETLIKQLIIVVPANLYEISEYETVSAPSILN